MPRALDLTPPLDAIAAQLAPALGQEKSREVVSAAAQALGSPDADGVLKYLARSPGIVGFAAQLVRDRMAIRSTLAAPTDPVPQSATRPVQAQAEAPGGRAPKETISIDAVIDIFAPALGAEASAKLVRSTLTRTGFQGEKLDFRAAMRLLEALANLEGPVRVAARFAKARVILLFRSSE
jgi:hypothetical protein